MLKAALRHGSAFATTTSTAAYVASQCWGGSGSYNGEALQKGMRENILSNIHQVGLVGGGVGFGWLDGKFKDNKDIRSFADFRHFECVGLDYVGKQWFEGCTKLSNIALPGSVKQIMANAFNNCTALTEIDLPASLAKVEEAAFSGCTGLKSIVVRGTTPATLISSPFPKNSGMKIYVPADKVQEYKTAWPAYADYIVGLNEYRTNKRITTTEPGQLASKLGLGVEMDRYLPVFDTQIRYVTGPIEKYDSLTISGPLNGYDVGVLRYLMGVDVWDANPTDGHLRYLNLWNATLKKDSRYSYNCYGVDDYLEKDNWAGAYMFQNCNAVETVILPKSVTEIGKYAFEKAKGLKRIAVGSNTTKLTRDLLKDLDGIEELVFLTDGFATSDSDDPWEAPIQSAFSTQKQAGNYMGDPGLTLRAQSVIAPFEDDAVMWALADKEHYFPSEYLLLNSAENIFRNNGNITKFDDFHYFNHVKRLDSTFEDCTGLESIALPDSIGYIGFAAFNNCSALKAIYIKCDSVPQIDPEAFDTQVRKQGDNFRIYVPKDLCKRYREAWPQYADYIGVDERHYSDDEIITVTVDKPNTLAQALGLTTTIKHYYGDGGDYVNNITGNYSKYKKLKVVGPISGADLDVLRYLSGWCPWTNARNYAGHLEYIDLYDTQVKNTDVGVLGYRKAASSFFMSEEPRLFLVNNDNELPHHALLRAHSLKTLILPKTCTAVQERALQECEALEVLVIGDDMEEFNWNALDDDAMLTRMYILAKKKVKISTDMAIWRWLCNNYNPTFDAFYVRPSLYNDYLSDNAYTGSSWQRTNNISKGIFAEDDSFCAFAAHGTATMDDLFNVSSVNGWFSGHTGIRDLTPLGYTIIDSLHTADISPLTQLEKVALPVTLKAVEDSLFTNAKNLRYVNMLMCDSTEIVADLRSRGFTRAGIDSLQTLVYLPATYGTAKGTNIVVADAPSHFSCETFRLVDERDYCVPYAFEAGKVENTRTLIKRQAPYSVCLPYTLDVPEYTKAYELAEREGSMLTFKQISGKMEALKPYLMVAHGNPWTPARPTDNLSLDTDMTQTIPASGSATFGHQDNVLGYSLRGTLDGIDNKTAASMNAYILQSDGKWHLVKSDTENAREASILPFRCYLLESVGNHARVIDMALEDNATGIDTIRTVDQDGTERYYDLNGRPVNGNTKGIIIKNGQKIINK